MWRGLGCLWLVALSSGCSRSRERASSPPPGVASPRPAPPCAPPARCTVIGKRLMEQPTTPELDVQAFIWFEAACEGGDAEGCAMLALAYKYGRGTAEDLPRSHELYAKSCSAGHAPGCFNQGLMEKVGLGTPQSWTAAEASYQKACDGHFGMACRELAKAHQTGEGLPKDLPLAAQYLKAACASKDEYPLPGELSCEELRTLCKTIQAPACTSP
ncbi:MAG: sel1 repeat family protein [Deltaproteobacteria bacterium]|nr:sel1 repeat family protein [Deltaproteobacteria bacterium]